jgi:hypothetical protein
LKLLCTYPSPGTATPLRVPTESESEAADASSFFFLRCWGPRGKNPYSALLSVLPFIPALVLGILAEIRNYRQVNQ